MPRRRTGTIARQQAARVERLAINLEPPRSAREPRRRNFHRKLIREHMHHRARVKKQKLFSQAARSNFGKKFRAGSGRVARGRSFRESRSAPSTSVGGPRRDSIWRGPFIMIPRVH